MSSVWIKLHLRPKFTGCVHRRAARTKEGRDWCIYSVKKAGLVRAGWRRGVSGGVSDCKSPRGCHRQEGIDRFWVVLRLAFLSVWNGPILSPSVPAFLPRCLILQSSAWIHCPCPVFPTAFPGPLVNRKKQKHSFGP